VRNFGNGNRPVYVMNADGRDQHAVHPGAQFVPAWQPPRRGPLRPLQAGSQ
jgi:hypothetical protein